MSLPVPWDKFDHEMSPNIGQNPDQEERIREMEYFLTHQSLVIAALQCEPWALRKLRVWKYRKQAPDSRGAYQRSDFSELRLLHFPIHRKAWNSLTWDAASWDWSPQNSHWIDHNSQLLGCEYFFKTTGIKETLSREERKKQRLEHWHWWRTLPGRSIWLRHPFFHKIVEWTLTLGNCNREEPNLTTCWICFFYLNLCFPLLLFTKRILSIYIMACLGEPCPSGWLLNQSAFVRQTSWPCPSVWTHPLPEAGHSRWYLQNLWPFYFSSSSPPPLCAIKETGIQTLIRWLFWDFSLPSSLSAGFLNKVVFLASAPCLGLTGLSCSEQSGAWTRWHSDKRLKMAWLSIL